MLDHLRYVARSLLRMRQVDGDLNDELAFHVDRETEKYVALGMPPAEARRRALVALGGLEKTKEAHRDRRGSRWLEDAVKDARYSIRALGREPSLAVTAILTLAIAIGANTAIFSAVNAVLLQPLPFGDPSSLVMVGENNPEFKWHMAEAAPANYLDWQARVAGFQDAMAYVDFPQSSTLIVNGEPRLLTVSFVTGNFFAVLGVNPQRGRLFQDQETWESATPVMVLSDRTWRRDFGADPEIVGKTVSLNGIARLVVGIAPRGLAFPWPTVDVWAPMAWQKSQVSATGFRRAHWLRVIARLRPGVSAEQANAQVRGVAANLRAEYPATNKVMDAELVPLLRFLVGDTRLPLQILLAAVGLLLLIACANVGHLLLIRAGSREREVALRVALGAGRLRLARQALTESLMLSLLGGAAGLALGWLGTRTLTALLPAGMLRVVSFGVDWTVVTYVFAVTTACGLLFGTAPAVWTSRRDPNDALKSGGRTSGHSAHLHRWGQRLAVFEVALALLLTVSAALLVRSYAMLQRVDPGFDPHGVLTASIQLPRARLNSAQGVAFFNNLVERLQAVPGVSNAAAVTQLPMTAPGWSSDFSLEGASAGHFSSPLLHRQVTPDYFRTMHVPLLLGRVFTSADRGTASVVVINDAFARQYFKDADPIGQRITFDRVPDSTSTWRTIVGVVGSEHQTTPATPPQIEAFAPIAQESSSQMTIVARTAGDPLSIGPAIRRIVAQLDPQLVVADIKPMSDVYATAIARDRFLMTLLSLFGVVGLVLAVVGVYGVVAQLARSRMREMGIRIALGAQAGSVSWLIVRRGLILTAIGAITGTGVALVATRGLRRLLYGVAPTDPLTFVVVLGALFTATLVASLLPGLKAARVDPTQTLREE
jgi:predicted permease